MFAADNNQVTVVNNVNFQKASSDSMSSVKATQQRRKESRVPSSHTYNKKKAYSLDQPIARGPRFSGIERPLPGDLVDAINNDYLQNMAKISSKSTAVMKEFEDANIGGRVINSSHSSVPNMPNIQGTQNQQNYYDNSMGRSAMENMANSMSQPIREDFRTTPDPPTGDFLWKSSPYMNSKGKGNLQLSSSSDSIQYEVEKFKRRAEMAERQVEELKMQLGALRTQAQELTIWKKSAVYFMSQYVEESSSCSGNIGADLVKNN